MGNILSICCPQFRRGNGDGKDEPLLPERDEQPTLPPVVQEPPSPRQGSYVVAIVPPTAAEVPVPPCGLEDAGEPTPAALIEPAPTDSSVKMAPHVLTFPSAPFSSAPDAVPVLPERLDTGKEAAAVAVANVVDVPAPITEPVIVAAVAPITTAVVPIERTILDTIDGFPAITLLPPSALLPPAVQGSAVVEQSWSPPRQSGPPRRSNSPQHPALVVKNHAAQPESPSPISSPFLEVTEPTELPLAVTAFLGPAKEASAESNNAEEEVALTVGVETAKDSAPMSPETPATTPIQTAVPEVSPTAEPESKSPVSYADATAVEPPPALILEVAPLAPPAVIPQAETNSSLFCLHEQERSVVPMALSAVYMEAPELSDAGATELTAVAVAEHEAITAPRGIEAAEAVPTTLAEYSAELEDGDGDGEPEEKPLAASVPSSSQSSTSGSKKRRSRGGKNKKKK